jgi:hypothetical protein
LDEFGEYIGKLYARFGVMIGSSVAATAYLRQARGYFTQQSRDEWQMERLRGVQAAEIRVWNPSLLKSGTLQSIAPKQKRATVVISWQGKSSGREALADEAVKILIQGDPRLKEQELIRVKIGRSYNLGIASGNDYQNFTHTPAEWSQRLAGGPGLTNPK